MQTTRSFHWIRGLTLGLIVLAGALWAAARLSSPTFDGQALPESPRQKDAWTAPPGTKLPEEFMTATAALFDLGLADPRGCEYRDIDIATGSCWSGDAGVATVHGWVMPAGTDAKAQRYAVAWNGLVYPLVKVGDRADLKADMEALCQGDELAQEKSKKDRPNSPFTRFNLALEDGTSASEKSMAPIKACLLVRLGETALAERIWADWGIGGQTGRGGKANDPFLELAGDWLWARFERAVTAHMRGDDRLSYLDAKALADMHNKADTLAEQRGFKKDQHGAEDPKTYFDFLGPVPRLLADEQRRVTEKPRVHVLTAGVAKFPDQDQRIATLIADLDQVNARQWGQPGGVSLADDPVVKALIAEGDQAVKPLIECLEMDDRLTRSVHFGRDFFRYRSLLGVSEAAYVAVSGILGQSFLGTGATGDDLSAHGREARQALAKEIRSYWAKYKGMPPAERWFAMLADDNSPREEWVQAAQNITQPTDVEVSPSSMFGTGWVTTPRRAPGEVIKLRGEVLRKKVAPSVADLLVKRLEAVSHGPREVANYELGGAMTLAEALIAWDGKGHLAELGALSKTMRERFDESTGPQSHQGREYLVYVMASLYGQRAALRDDKALAEYATWVKTVTPEDAGSNVERMFQPMWRFGAKPVIADVAEQLFGGEDSPWNPLLQKRQHDYGWGRQVERLLQTPLLGLPAMRKQLFRELEVKDVAGTAEVNAEGHVTLNIESGAPSAGTMWDKDDPLKPKDREKRPFRHCDVVAAHLSAIDGFPRIEMFWPEAQRDTALARTRDVLEHYGQRLEWTPEQETIKPFFFMPIMTFAPLAHVATAEDVAQGKAIFSVEGQRRLWTLPARPQPARWTTLHSVATAAFGYDEQTKTNKSFTAWRQDGYVWQAEEVLQDGKWQRWLGFVGPGIIGKAPAEEIELKLPDHWQWRPMGHGTEWRVMGPGARPEGKPELPAVAAEPLVAELRIRNIRAVDQSVETEWYRPSEKAWREGVTLRLEKAGGIPNAQGIWSEEQWAEAPANQTKHFSPGKHEKILAPAEELPAIKFDLRDTFAIEPGTYRLRVIRPKGPEDQRTPETEAVVFNVVEKGSGGK